MVAPSDCGSAMRKLWDYLDAELPADRTAQIRLHLATCTGCDAHLRFCRAFLQQIDLPSVSTAEVSVLRERALDVLRRDGLTV